MLAYQAYHSPYALETDFSCTKLKGRGGVNGSYLERALMALGVALNRGNKTFIKRLLQTLGLISFFV